MINYRGLGVISEIGLYIIQSGSNSIVQITIVKEVSCSVYFAGYGNLFEGIGMLLFCYH